MLRRRSRRSAGGRRWTARAARRHAEHEAGTGQHGAGRRCNFDRVAFKFSQKHPVYCKYLYKKHPVYCSICTSLATRHFVPAAEADKLLTVLTLFACACRLNTAPRWLCKLALLPKFKRPTGQTSTRSSAGKRAECRSEIFGTWGTAKLVFFPCQHCTPLR